MREVVYCDDCPILRLCRDEGQECDYTRWIHKVTSEAPPLTRQQIKTVATILRRAITPPAPARVDQNKHRMAGPFRCKVLDCNATLKHRGSLWQHLRLCHDRMTMAEYIQKYGELVPLAPEEEAELVVEARCDVDGCDKIYSTELGHRWPRGALISHLRGRHGLKPDYTPIRTES